MPDFDPKTQPREFLSALAAELGRPIAAVRSPSGDVVAVAKCPDIFGAMGNYVRASAGTDAGAGKALVLSCVVYPDAAAAKAILDDHPAMLEKLDARVFELAGGDFERVGPDTFKAPDGRVVALQKPHNVAAIHAKLKIATRDTAWRETRDFVLGFAVNRAEAASIISEWPAMIPALKAQCDVHCGSESEDLGKF
jgi:hypothetical protein